MLNFSGILPSALGCTSYLCFLDRDSSDVTILSPQFNSTSADRALGLGSMGSVHILLQPGTRMNHILFWPILFYSILFHTTQSFYICMYICKAKVLFYVYFNTPSTDFIFISVSNSIFIFISIASLLRNPGHFDIIYPKSESVVIDFMRALSVQREVYSAAVSRSTSSQPQVSGRLSFCCFISPLYFCVYPCSALAFLMSFWPLPI